MLQRTLSVAPMLDWSDRHARYFWRLISRHVMLYTEMLTTGALLYGDRERFLAYDPFEHPVALQLGGSDPAHMAACARMAEDYGYVEVNMNVGCPSDRVQSGYFGACLMVEPERVAECIASMTQSVKIPVTVKTRLGIDDRDSYAELATFVRTVAEAGCHIFIVHARKAWLKGLNPRENREIPPLHYEVVHRLKRDFPELQFVLNGGIKDLEQAQQHLTDLDGVMIGREVYQNPYLLAQVDEWFYQDTHPIPSRHEIIERFIPYVESQLAQDIPLSRMTRHLLGLFQGVRGARAWRRYLSEHAHQPEAGSQVIAEATRRIIHQDETSV